MKIAKDKWKHFFVGIAMGVVFQVFFLLLLHLQTGLSITLSLLCSFVVAYGFELYSKFTGEGYYEVMDAVAALIGAIPGVGLVLLLQVF